MEIVMGHPRVWCVPRIGNLHSLKVLTGPLQARRHAMQDQGGRVPRHQESILILTIPPPTGK